MVGTTRFELVVFCSQSRRDNQATLRPERMLFSADWPFFSRVLLLFEEIHEDSVDEAPLNQQGQDGLEGVIPSH